MRIGHDDADPVGDRSQAVRAEVNRMLREDPSFAKGMMAYGGARRDVEVPNGLHVVMDRGYDENRGSFTGDMTLYGDEGLRREVQVRGFLDGDEAVIAQVRSTRKVTEVAGDGRDVHVADDVYLATIRDGRKVEDAVTYVTDATVRGHLLAAGGGFVLVDAMENVRPIVVSSPEMAADLREAVLDAADLGGIAKLEGMQSNLNLEGRIDLASISSTRTDYAEERTSYRMAIVEDAVRSYRTAEAERHFEVLGGESIARPELASKALEAVENRKGVVTPVDEPVGVPVRGGAFSIRDDGLDVTVRVHGEHPYDLKFGIDDEGNHFFHRLSMKATVLEGADTQVPLLRDVDVRVYRDGSVGVRDDLPSTSIYLATEGGRLYAVDGAVRNVSEVVGGVDDVDVRDLKRKVAGLEGVADAYAPVIGRIGDGPVRIGPVSSLEPDSYANADEVVSLVHAHRLVEARSGGLMSQASGVAAERGGGAEPTRSVGPQERTGWLDRMKEKIGLGGGRD